MKHCVRIGAFVVLGALLFTLVQNLLSNKWFYPADWNDPKYTFDEFYDITGDSNVQVLLLGASHVFCGIDPMEIYKETGITVYDLSTSTQPIEISYYILEDALARTKPECVFLDTSLFFRMEAGEAWYQRVLDNMAFSPAKVHLASAYAERVGGEHREMTFLGAFLPIYNYHTRWPELKEIDFTAGGNMNLYNKGFYYYGLATQPAELDVETMNQIEEDYKHYAVEEENVEYLLKMKRMCEAAGAGLHLFAVPSLGNPRAYPGAWTRGKSDAIRAMSEQCGIPYLDMMYDVDLGLDWSTDTMDGGMHLNTNGVGKATAFMASYLRDACGLKGEENRHYEADLATHRIMERCAHLLWSRSIASYLETLPEMENVCAFFAVCGDMRDILKPEDMAALNALGLETDFGSMAGGGAYLAVVDEGKVLYEASGEEELQYKDELESGLSYQLSSRSLSAGGKSQIKVYGKERGVNKQGLNIVVYDKKARRVLDSVCFAADTEGNQRADRKDKPSVYLRNYSAWMARENYSQGIR